jgi:hypothetical protein
MAIKREKIALLGGGGFLFLLLLYQLGISPLRERIEILEGRIQSREEDLREIRSLKNEHLLRQENLKLIEQGLIARGEDFHLFSFLERLTVEVGIRERISSMRPRERLVSDLYEESIVEVKLNGIDLSELTNYLYRIENPNRFLTINNLRLKPQRGSPGRVEVSFEVSTLILR